MTNDGTALANQVAKFKSPCAVGSSQLVDDGTNVGIGTGTTAPASKLDVKGGAFIRGPLNLPASGTATTAAGSSSFGINFIASVVNSTIGAVIPQTFRWRAEPVANNTASASSKLSLMFGAGINPIVATGLSVSNKGLITFASGQAFPIPSKSVTSAQIGSTTAANGQVFAANGSGGAVWITLAAPAGGVNGVREFKSNGNLLVPAGVTKLRVDAYGAGGGGGGGDNSTPTYGGDGGAGAYEAGVIAVTPGTNLTITIGTGGAAGANGSTTGTAGSGGSDSRISASSTVLLSAGGGAGGGGASSGVHGTGGAGGSAGTTGSINHAGISGACDVSGDLCGKGYTPVGFATSVNDGGDGGLTAAADPTAGKPGYMLLTW